MARAVHAHKTSALRTILDIIDINRARGLTWNQVLTGPTDRLIGQSDYTRQYRDPTCLTNPPPQLL